VSAWPAWAKATAISRRPHWRVKPSAAEIVAASNLDINLANTQDSRIYDF
jgi:hypothetical protein